MKHNYPYNLWLQFLQGTRLGKHVMLIFGVLFFMLFSSWNVVGQSTVTPSYEWLKAVPFGTVTQAETSGLTIAIDTDSQGNVYRLTFGDGVLKYDAEGIFIKKIIQANQLNDPLDIALDSNDNIYVIDYEDQAPFTDNGKIKIFNPLGVQIDRILTTYFRPLGIALDNEDNIYVVIYNDGSGAESNVSSELRVYNSNRTLIKKFGGTSAHPLLQPYRIGVDSQKNIYISHTANNGEVVVFDSSYNYLTTLSGMGSPGSVVVDEFDFIHVIDYSDRINFNQLLNYQTISQGELFFLYIGINTGISMKEFGIRIYDSNRVLQNPFFKDHLELPVDIAFGSCDRMFVNNSKTNGLSLEFELEIYKRTPSFDGEKPEIISCVPDQNATLTNGEFILPDYTGLAVFNAIDNCDKDLTITQNPPKDTSITGTRTVTITATDDAGNFASCDFEVIIEDEVVAPTFTCPSADTAPDLSLDTNCNFSAPSYSNLITNLTNFENDPFFDQSEVRSGNLLSVNIKIYDGDGGDFIGECNLNVNLIDNIDPQFTLCNIQNITVELEEGETYPVPNFVSQLTATDNCDSNPVITQSINEGTPITETTTIIITATDAANNTSNNCEVSIIITERQNPTFNCPSADAAPDLNLDSNCNFSAPSYSNLITNLTNFENDPFFDQSEVRSGNLLSVNIKIYDGDGGDFIGECNLNVNLVDNIDPQFTSCNIQNITVELEEGETYPVPNFVSQLTATDNCDSNPVITQSINEGTPITETTTIIITATDAANNTSNNCEVSIIITERQNPTFTCPSADAAPDLNLDSNCNFSSPSYSNLITNLTNFENDPFFDQSEVRSGNLLSVNIKIYDGDGGDFIGECNLNVNLVDNIDPQFTSCNIQDINVELENGETFAVPDFVSQLNATDNCDSNPVITQSIAYGTSITETTLITLIATDESGNVSNTCEVSINIAEKQDPTFDCLDPNQTTVLELDENCTYSVPNYSGRVTNFQNFTNEPFFVQTQVRNEDVLAVTINVFDGVNGEEAGSCQFLVNLEDQIPPVLTCPNDILIPYTDSKEYEIEDYYSQLIITDNCSDSFTYIQTPQPGSIVSEDTRIEFTIIDENNNQSSCNFEVKFYKESELQILNCPGDQIFEVDSNCSYLIPDIASSITTNIEGAVVTQNITPGFRVNGSLQLIITAKFEDQTDTCFVDLMAKDSTAPVVGCLEDQNETFDSENGFIIPNYSLQAQTSDNCFIAKIDQIPDVGTEVFEDTQVTIGVEDISGNYTTCTFTVFLTEETTGNNVPVALNDTYSIDQDAILSIGSPGVLGNDTDADNDLLTAIIQTQATNGTVSLNTDGSFTYTPDNGYFGPDTFTYVANDGTVNSNVATVTIAVKDTSLPNSIPVALDDTFEVDQNSILSIPIPGILGNDSDADNDNLIAIIESEPTSGELILNNDGSFTYTPNSGFTGEVTFTYVANDGSENSNVATVTITVTATTNTNVICKDSVTLELDENGVVTLDAASLFTSRPDDLQFSVDQEVFTCEDLGENTVTLSYSNNDVQSSCEVMIIINDVSPPTINIKDINVALNEFGSITITPDMLNNGTSDNCKNLSYSLSKQTFGCKDLGANTVTFTATDASGNSSSTDASVTVTGDCKINPLPGVEYIFIYPNPTSGPFQFATPAGVTIQRVEVFDFRGRMILFKDYSESDLEYIMDLTGVQNAVYILNLFTSEGMEIIRVIIN